MMVRSVIDLLTFGTAVAVVFLLLMTVFLLLMTVIDYWRHP